MTDNDSKKNYKTTEFKITVPKEYYGSSYIPTPEELQAEDPLIDITEFNKDTPKGLKADPNTLWGNLRS